MTWKILELGASPIEFIDGDRSSNYPKRSELVEDGIPFFSTQNIANNRFNYRDVAFITEEKLATLRKGKLIDEDIVITTRGTLGNAAIFSAGEFETAFINAQMLILRVADKNQLNYRFLYYWIISNETQVKFRNHASGTAQPQLPIRDLKRVTISIPPIEEQKRIADILSAYDDLIDNNNRRIALLEEAIHRLYREWFVHLRFPGHEHTAVVAGVPEGWEKRPLAEIAHINAESIRKNNAPENIEYIDISSVGTGIINEIKAIDFADAPSRARRIVKHGDIIWSTVRPGNRAYSLILNPNPNTIASTGFAVLTAQIVPFTFLYQAVITDEFVEHMAKVAKGAAYPAVSTSDFEKVKILVPSQSLLNEFEQMAKPIARQTQTLRLQNEKLREARDALLPRLMNGSLPV